jgi:hypothetical protein
VRKTSLLLLAVLLGACSGGGDKGDGAAAPAQPATTTAPAGACGLKPITFANERWHGSPTPAPGGAGVVWEQAYTFTNPNTVDVRLSSLVVHLRLSDQGGHFLKFARSTFRPAAEDTIPAGRDQERVAQVWLALGNTPATEDLFASTSAKVAGADCPVAVERISSGAVPAHVLALTSCDPREAPAAC